MIAAVFFALVLAAPKPTAKPHSQPREDADEIDIDVPDLDIDIPDLDIDIPAIHIPEIRIPRIEVPDVSFLVAHAKQKHRDRDEDEDRNDDDDDDDCVGNCGPAAPVPPVPPMPPLPAMPALPSYPDTNFQREDRNGVHIYRMQTPGMSNTRIRINRHDDDDEMDSDSSAHARGQGQATLAVKGPVTFRVNAQGGDIDVTSTDKQQVMVRVEGTRGSSEVSLYSYGDRVEPRFKNRHSLRGGKLHVELPKGSRLEVESMSGDINVQRLDAAKVHTLSGQIRLAQVGKVDVQSISGDVQIQDAAGPVRLHTVSGKASLAMRNPSPQVEFQSASGSLDFKGACGRDCHLSANTVSGDLNLALAPQSSFELSYSSHSGELRDGLDLNVRRSGRGRHGSHGSLEGTYGKGEGVIEADAFSGNLTLSKQ
ncbi:MAG TPA: DUF4097 family beta strand repeat-containing protein [Myxococcales bacterium]|jgi:hypothetical protein